MMRAAGIGCCLFFVLFTSALPAPSRAEDDPALQPEAAAALKQAATYFRQHVALRGGYVYYYSLDLKQRFGEGTATADQIWVQPPGTPAVGMAYIAAYRATHDPFYRDAARETAAALLYGQLQSGGWQNLIDFNPRSDKAGLYRNGQGRGRNYSTLDDNATQSALRFLMQVDRAFDFQDEALHAATQAGLDALLAAQFANGAFPQVWSGPAAKQPVIRASYPDYDWKTEQRVKEYWNFYTLNDNLAGDVAAVLIDAAEIYQDPKYLAALAKLGDFLMLAQMPDPQPAWAQQYSYAMHPVWARKFEPPAITGRESQDALETLITIYNYTGEAKYLAPILKALAYLKSCRLPDGKLARYYELKTNKPLYMTRAYQLTYDDGDLPTHYGFKVEANLEKIEKAYASAKERGPQFVVKRRPPSSAAVRQVIDALDAEGRWISTYAGESLAGQPKFKSGDKYLASAVFSKNVEILAAFLEGKK